MPVNFERSEFPKLPNLTISPQIIAPVVIALIAFSAVMTSIYTVPAESIAVVLRFGKAVAEVESGLRFKLPFGIDRIQKVPVKRQLKQEFGFSTPGATNRSQTSRESARETAMVTGDLNAALVEWILQYRIVRPTEYLFNVRDPADTLRDVSESVMREVVGDRTVDEVITIGRQEIEAEALVKMQEVVNRYAMGLMIDQVQLKNVNPPRAVQSSFDEVNKAQQEREKLINIANGEYNKAVPKARGKANRQVLEAEGYKIKRINEAQGDADRFNSLLTEYVKAPDITRRRLYLEAMAEVLPTLQSKIIIDESVKGILPMLQLENSGKGQ